MNAIIFKITEIRCDDGVWKFYPDAGLPPICIKDSLLSPMKAQVLRVGSLAAHEARRLCINTENGRSVTRLGMDFVTLFDLSQTPDCPEIPVLPDAYRPTEKVCMRNLQRDCSNSCCPWCKQIASAGYFTMKYPSEHYRFTPEIKNKR